MVNRCDTEAIASLQKWYPRMLYLQKCDLFMLGNFANLLKRQHSNWIINVSDSIRNKFIMLGKWSIGAILKRSHLCRNDTQGCFIYKNVTLSCSGILQIYWSGNIQIESLMFQTLLGISLSCWKNGQSVRYWSDRIFAEIIPKDVISTKMWPFHAREFCKFIEAATFKFYH